MIHIENYKRIFNTHQSYRRSEVSNQKIILACLYSTACMCLCVCFCRLFVSVILVFLSTGSVWTSLKGHHCWIKICQNKHGDSLNKLMVFIDSTASRVVSQRFRTTKCATPVSNLRHYQTLPTLSWELYFHRELKCYLAWSLMLCH